MLKLIPLTAELSEKLDAAAAEDRHGVILPTHVVMRDGEVIGYGSLGRASLFFAWMSSKRATPRESFRAWELAEEELRRAGHDVICLPCEESSPFAPFMQKRDYLKLGHAAFNLKVLAAHPKSKE